MERRVGDHQEALIIHLPLKKGAFLKTPHWKKRGRAHLYSLNYRVIVKGI